MAAKDRQAQDLALLKDHRKWIQQNEEHRKPAKTRAPRSGSTLSQFCSGTTFDLVDDNFSIRHITVQPDGGFLYKGTPATLAIGKKIGAGSFGKVELATLTTVDGDFKCAVKTTWKGETLEELIALRLFPEALSCDGVLNFVPISSTAILMPLASGAISGLMQRTTLDQTLQIVLRVGEQMSCLLHHGVKYYDLKPANVLYYCRGEGRMDISLADIGSIIPEDNGYAASYTPAEHPYGLPADLSYQYITRYYTYLMLNFISLMVTREPINITSPRYASYSCRDFVAGLTRKHGGHPAIGLLKQVAVNMGEGGLDAVIPFEEFLDQIDEVTST